MQTKTVDVLVREALVAMGYSIHYYLPLLHHALRGLESLSQDLDFGSNVKEVSLDIDSANRATIPPDAVDIIGVYGRYGDKLKSFHFSDRIPFTPNTNDSGNIPYLEEDSTMPEFQDVKSSRPMPFTSTNDLPTVIYPSDDYQYEYNVDVVNSKLILGNGHLVSKVFLRYLTSNVSTTSANVIHPYVVDAIHAYVEYMYYKNDKNSPQSKVALKKNEYYNEVRLSTSRLSNLSYDQIMQKLYNT